MKRIIHELDVIELMKDAIKKMSMNYQFELKMKAAEFNGVSANAYFDLSYEEWAKIRSEYLEKTK